MRPGVATFVGSVRKHSPLQIKATNWPHADEIDIYNSDLIATITKVIVGITILTENHLILLKDLFGLDIKQWKK
jgi:hypothetical protein